MSGIPEHVRAIIREVSAKHGLEPSALIGERQTRRVAYARWEAMKLVRATTWLGAPPNYSQIGRWFNRDHTTVMNALNRDMRSRKNCAHKTPIHTPVDYCGQDRL